MAGCRDRGGAARRRDDGRGGSRRRPPPVRRWRPCRAGSGGSPYERPRPAARSWAPASGAARPPAGSWVSSQLPVAKTAGEVVVDHAGRLHEGIADRGADKAKTAPAEVLAHRVGLRRLRGHVARIAPAILHGPAADEAPDVCVEAP